MSMNGLVSSLWKQNEYHIVDTEVFHIDNIYVEPWVRVSWSKDKTWKNNDSCLGRLLRFCRWPVN